MTTRALLARLTRHDRVPLLLLGTLVLITSLATAAAVRGLSRESDAALRETIAAAPARASGVSVQFMPIESRATMFSPERLSSQGSSLRELMSRRLQSALAAPVWATSTTRVELIPPRDALGLAHYYVNLRAQQDLAEHVRVVEGALPGRGVGVAEPGGPVFEAVVTRSSADTLNLRVGDEITLLPPPVGSRFVSTVGAPPRRDGRLEITGIVDLVDPQSGYWAQSLSGGGGWAVDDGSSPPEFHGVGIRLFRCGVHRHGRRPGDPSGDQLVDARRGTRCRQPARRRRVPVGSAGDAGPGPAGFRGCRSCGRRS